jgi:uncharacterized membrane protein YidH (DUF202 family)
MKQKLFRIASYSGLPFLVTSIFSAGVAWAAAPAALATTESALNSKVLCPIVDAMFDILIVVTIIMVMWAAWTYLTAGDDTEKVHRATKTLTYAAVAVVVAILAKGFPFLVDSIVGDTTGTGLGC